MNNPYQVLGVSENATDEEIKSAYRALAKKYHPDNYTNSPLADVAEQKMKEINEAYDTINQMRQKGKGTGSSANTNYYNGNASGSQFYNVRIYIQRNMINQAEQILDTTPQSNRTAEWHFLKGMCSFKRGFNEQAVNYFTTACNMDPNNNEYRSALNNMNVQRSYNYGGYNQPYGNNMGGSSCSVCDICTAMMCADCLCDCCR